MYARLQTTRTVPTIPDIEAVRRQVVGMISAHPGFAGCYMLEQVGTGWGTMLTLWHTREDAELAAKRSEQVRGPRPVTLHSDDVYEVEDDVACLAAGEPPRSAAMVFFDGPLSPARTAAARRGFTDRIRPALQQVPGMVRVITMWHPEQAKAVSLSLATSVEAVEDGGRAVNATELLPGEDPALLTGPDRFEIHRVVATAVPS